jgi:hypothetical protein
MKRAWAAWLGWWFDGVDPRRLAMLRIGYALLALWAYVPMLDELDWLLGDPGTFSVDSRLEHWSDARWNVYANPLWQVRDLAVIQGIFTLGLVSLVCVGLGLGTRVTFPLAWVLLLSAANRNPVWADGSDAMLRVFGFYMLFMPLGRAWSLDALIFKRERPRPSKWPLRLFQIQVAILYVKTGTIKILEERWREGEAVWHALSAQTYWRFDASWFFQQRWFEWFTNAATYGTLVFELGFPLMFFRRLRPAMLVAGLGLHIGIFIFLSLGGFSEAILWTYLAFWVPAFLRKPKDAS